MNIQTGSVYQDLLNKNNLYGDVNSTNITVDSLQISGGANNQILYCGSDGKTALWANQNSYTGISPISVSMNNKTGTIALSMTGTNNISYTVSGMTGTIACNISAGTGMSFVGSRLDCTLVSLTGPTGPIGNTGPTGPAGAINTSITGATGIGVSFSGNTGTISNKGVVSITSSNGLSCITGLNGNMICGTGSDALTLASLISTSKVAIGTTSLNTQPFFVQGQSYLNGYMAIGGNNPPSSDRQVYLSMLLPQSANSNQQGQVIALYPNQASTGTSGNIYGINNYINHAYVSAGATGLNYYGYSSGNWATNYPAGCYANSWAMDLNAIPFGSTTQGALRTDNICIGTRTTPPTNGIVCQGNILCSATGSFVTTYTTSQANVNQLYFTPLLISGLAQSVMNVYSETQLTSLVWSFSASSTGSALASFCRMGSTTGGIVNAMIQSPKTVGIVFGSGYPSFAIPPKWGAYQSQQITIPTVGSAGATGSAQICLLDIQAGGNITNTNCFLLSSTGGTPFNSGTFYMSPFGNSGKYWNISYNTSLL
jgi:hypothetical protein